MLRELERSGKDGKPIATYLLPIEDKERGKLYTWTRTYRDLDRIWMASGPLEIPAYRELADPRSMHGREARRICHEIETGTGLPTYYFLLRYHGFVRGEDQRRCPLCGGKWHRATTQAPFRGVHGFEFRCDACRLVSVAGAELGESRLAKIGSVARGRTSARRSIR